jgi:hypothetical protein
LNNGNYYGLDKEKDLIEAGIKFELPKHELENSHPIFIVDGNFNLDKLDESIKFDFVLAHSVFTHIVPELIKQCLTRIIPRLADNGQLFTTFHKSLNEKIDINRPLSGYQAWRKNERHLTRYPFSLFEEISKEVGCSVSYIGKWGHIHNKINRQLMLKFTK